MDEDFEKGTGPRKFSFDELALATSNFAEEILAGGFGGVCRGFLRELNSHVAVKRVSRGYTFVFLATLSKKAVGEKKKKRGNQQRGIGFRKKKATGFKQGLGFLFFGEKREEKRSAFRYGLFFLISSLSCPLLFLERLKKSELGIKGPIPSAIYFPMPSCTEGSQSLFFFYYLFLAWESLPGQ
ncbi:unnamed protein product, partial [Vitis vinifera]